jgi:rhomboid family GlyGly-CTERM serine protease
MQHKPSMPIITAALVLLLLMLNASPYCVAILEYRADAMADGEWWRLLTWHAAHWSGRHLAWDLVAFAILGCLCERQSRRVFVAGLLASVPAVSLAVLVLHPNLPSCRGLSGIDCALFGLFVAGALDRALVDREHVRASMLGAAGIGFLAKTLYELRTGQATFAGSGFIALPSAHLAGLLVGLAVYLVDKWRSLARRRWRAGDETAMVLAGTQ